MGLKGSVVQNISQILTFPQRLRFTESHKPATASNRSAPAQPLSSPPPVGDDWRPSSIPRSPFPSRVFGAFDLPKAAAGSAVRAAGRFWLVDCWWRLHSVPLHWSNPNGGQ